MEVFFMEKAKKSFFTAKNIAILAVLLALVVVLQVFGLAIPMPGGTSMSFVLVPIIVGGMLLGPVAGTFLGCVFGIITIFDPLAMLLMNYAPATTIITVVLKGTLAGLVPSLLFGLVSKKNRYAASFVAAASAPIVNTGVFFIGCLCMQNAIVQSVGTGFWVFIGLIMINFAIELAVNIVLAPAIYTIDNVIEKRFSGKSKAKTKVQEEI